jgi:hypothetical protein
MIVYYAMGGGLGHLTRGRAVLDHLFPGREAALLTTSPHAADARVTGGRRVIAPPANATKDRAALRAWLAGALPELAPGVVVLDAFPAGVLGEWCGLAIPEGIELWHAARLLRWDAYRRRLDAPAPRLARTFVLEPLGRRHRKFLRTHSSTVENLFLPPSPDSRLQTPDSRLQGYWLVVHSGPAPETAALVRHAEDLRRVEDPSAELLVATPARDRDAVAVVPHARFVDANPAAALFPHAARIVTACGFNAFRETRAFADKHVFVPFPRALDDQFRRAARRGRP